MIEQLKSGVIGASSKFIKLVSTLLCSVFVEGEGERKSIFGWCKSQRFPFKASATVQLSMVPLSWLFVNFLPGTHPQPALQSRFESKFNYNFKFCLHNSTVSRFMKCLTIIIISINSRSSVWVVNGSRERLFCGNKILFHFRKEKEEKIEKKKNRKKNV